MAVDPVIVDEAQLAPVVTKLSESAEETLKNLANEDINLEFTDEESAGDKQKKPRRLKLTTRR
jgi:type IV pilus assembly protein PilB